MMLILNVRLDFSNTSLTEILFLPSMSLRSFSDCPHLKSIKEVEIIHFTAKLFNREP